jgi:hypothetical protein
MTKGRSTIRSEELLDSAVQDDKLDDATKLLAEGGANPNFKGSSGITMLNWAIYNQNLPMVKLLIDKGASVNARNAADRGTRNDESKFAPLQTVFTEKYNSGRKLNHQIAKNILDVLVSAGALEAFVFEKDEKAGETEFKRAFSKGLHWMHATPAEIKAWIKKAKEQVKRGGGRRRRRNTKKITRRRRRQHKTRHRRF